MLWTLLALTSAFLLGFYDLLKKNSLKENAVIPVLFISSLSGALIFICLFLFSRMTGKTTAGMLFVPMVSWKEHIYFFIKSIIVGSSWILAYFAFKHLPITIASPIRASAPLWTVAGAFIIFHEKFSPLQWTGVATTMFFYYCLSFEGKKEGVHFRNNRWVLFMLISTILGAFSSLYDKFLINHFNRMAVQAYSTIYIALIFLPVILFLWYPKRANSTPFTWRITIPLIGVCLAFADFAYFYAISVPFSLISAISIIRRGSVIVAFTWGYFIFKEKNLKRKAMILTGIMLGLGMIILGSC